MTIELGMTFNPNLCHNEREVESKFVVSYLLPQLGYDTRMWSQETKQHRFRLDFLAYTDQNYTTAQKIVIETKHPKKQLAGGRYQLQNYMLALQIDYGLLTNGYELFIYRRDSNIKVEEIFQCHTKDIANNIDYIRSLIGRTQLANSKHKITDIIQKSHDMKILAIFHNKGGVGKTTTTVNLADAIARMGKKVLIVDIDSQANTTFATGLMNFGDEWSDNIKDNYVYHLLIDKDTYSLDQIAVKARFTSQDIDVIPSHIHLMQQETELNRLSHINVILRRKLEKSAKHYDIVLIDTPPSLNLYARISLITADYLIIPSDLKIFANEGLENVKGLIKEVTEFKDMINLPPLKVLGILPTKILNHPKLIEKLKQQLIPKIEQNYGISVLRDYMIIERIDLARCFDQTLEIGEMNIPNPQSIFEYNPSSPSVGEFTDLATYVIKQMELSA